MRSSGKMMMRCLLALALLVLVLAIVFWAVRPSPYGEWLGLEGLGQLTPLFVTREWANGRLGPRTPLGFLSQFPTVDLSIAGALLTAIAIVLILLWNPGWDGRPGSGLSKRIRVLRPRGVSLRVRTILVLVAILALDLGWEVVAWRAWRLRATYLARRNHIVSNQKHYKDGLRNAKLALANLEAGHSLSLEQMMYTAEAKAAILSYDRDRLTREASYNSALVEYYDDKLIHKYEAAAEDPLRPIPPDPPPREHLPEGDPYFWLANRKYERALTGFDELIRLYPDYPDAHDCRAWLLATSPLATIRNGKLAVFEARRACELTNWKVPRFVATLAAAYAEAGDFASAVSWEQKAREGSYPRLGVDEDRLALYKAGKPLRLPRALESRMPSSAAPKATPSSSGAR